MISLVPEWIIKAMKTINGRQGYLLRQFSIELLGVRWMPNDWESAFMSHWTRCRTQMGLLPLEDVDRHLDGLESNLSSSDFVEKLADGLRLESNTAQWNTEGAGRLLTSRELRELMSRGAALEKSMQNVVFTEIADHIRKRVRSKLDRDMARFQVERVGARPRCDETPRTSFQDALDFVATMSAMLTHGDAGEDAEVVEGKELSRTGGTGVQRALAGFARRDPNLRKTLRFNVLRLRRCLTDGASAPEGERDQLLIAAWQSLKGVSRATGAMSCRRGARRGWRMRTRRRRR